MRWVVRITTTYSAPALRLYQAHDPELTCSTPLPRSASFRRLTGTQKNKATSYHLGQLKAKLAKLRRELIAPPSGGGSQAGAGFDVARTGVASVGVSFGLSA